MNLTHFGSAAGQSRNRRVQPGGGTSALLADWIARSTAAGVQTALLYDNSAIVTNNIHQDGAQAGVSWDTTDGIIPGTGCLKISHAASNSAANAGLWRYPLKPVFGSLPDAQGFGSTPFYLSWFERLSPHRLVQTTGGGFKSIVLGEYRPSSPNSSNSHTGNEIVMTNNDWYGMPICYREHPVSGTTQFGIPDGGGGLLQNAVDHGAGFSDPNDRYCQYQSGHGSVGCWFYQEDVWYAHQLRIEIVDFGGAGTGNKFACWAARKGETSWSPLYDITNFRIGTDSLTPLGPQGLWFTAYDTNRNAPATWDVWQKFDQPIVSLNAIACPQVWPA